MNVQELIDVINQQWRERLDKIRAEIEKEMSLQRKSIEYDIAIGSIGLRKALEIINKYITESEVSE